MSLLSFTLVIQTVNQNLLGVGFGELDTELTAIIESLLALFPEEPTPLLLQSREKLITQFRSN